ncbi:hypothetical protein [Companilactobacillus musae]|nr:hypothetical protein [Companilactobacillus musae]
MMNKEKIMDQLMDIRELTGGADSPSIDLKKDLMAIRDISSNTLKELNSKIVMPKVFDDWYQFVAKDCGENPEYLERWVYLSYMEQAPNSDQKFSSKEEIAFGKWLYGDVDDTSARKQQLVTNAIMDGFEVEK